MTPSLQCPTCGAPLPIRSPVTVLAVCEYCQTASYWNAEILTSAGVRSVLPEGFTRLYRGARGWLDGQHFEVIGRIRYAHARGQWDEWFAAAAGSQSAWITEDDHELAVQHLAQGADLSFAVQLVPGARFAFASVAYEVDEVGEATCIGFEGELPKRVEDGWRHRYVDASSLDGRFALGIELEATPPSCFVGRWLAHDDVRLADEGNAW